MVHNGIIENYQQLKNQLTAQGYSFVSPTDTEVAAKLIDSLYDGDPIAALQKAQELLEGSYAFAIMFADRPGELYATRLGSPLIAAVGDQENFLASDVPAVLKYTRRYALIAERQIVRITKDEIAIYNPDGTIAPLELFEAVGRWNKRKRAVSSTLCARKFMSSRARWRTQCVLGSVTVCLVLRTRTVYRRDFGSSLAVSPLSRAGRPCTPVWSAEC